MQYAFLIYQDDEAWQNADQTERDAIYAQHGAMIARLQADGAMRGGEELGAVAHATTLRRAGDSYVVADGPFAETTEQLGGFYIVESPDLDAALDYARMLPEGTVEIRPLVTKEKVA